MRTTIELTDEQRAQLLELAARRGMKGFSVLIQEAVDLYLKERARREEAVRAALGAVGAIDDAGADALVDAMRRSRESWR